MRKRTTSVTEACLHIWCHIQITEGAAMIPCPVCWTLAKLTDCHVYFVYHMFGFWLCFPPGFYFISLLIHLYAEASHWGCDGESPCSTGGAAVLTASVKICPETSLYPHLILSPWLGPNVTPPLFFKPYLTTVLTLALCNGRELPPTCMLRLWEAQMRKWT